VETIQQAAGLELPFGKADVYANLVQWIPMDASDVVGFRIVLEIN
jgi:hypothetical protein